MKRDYFDLNTIKYVDYKNVEVLKRLLSPSGKIISGKRCGISAKNQRKFSLAIKQARFLGLLPYIIK